MRKFIPTPKGGRRSRDDGAPVSWDTPASGAPTTSFHAGKCIPLAATPSAWRLSSSLNRGSSATGLNPRLMSCTPVRGAVDTPSGASDEIARHRRGLRSSRWYPPAACSPDRLLKLCRVPEKLGEAFLLRSSTREQRTDRLPATDRLAGRWNVGDQRQRIVGTRGGIQPR